MNDIRRSPRTDAELDKIVKKGNRKLKKKKNYKRIVAALMASVVMVTTGAFILPASAPKTTGKDGRISFENIASGYYAVKETHTPEGYIITGEDTFYIKVDKAGVRLLRKIVTDTEEEKSVTFEEAAEEDGKICVGNVTYTVESGTVLLTVENEPGAALPDAGGPGTNLISLFGIMLTGIAGAGLLMKRRRSRI